MVAVAVPSLRRWEPTRENVRMRLRKSYLNGSFVRTEARDMAKTPAKGKRVKWIRYVLLGVVGMGVYHILTGPSGALNLLRLKRDKAKMVADLDSLSQRKQDLVIEKGRLEKDTAYIERVARKELGMAKPDEKVFRFVTPKDQKP